MNAKEQHFWVNEELEKYSLIYESTDDLFQYKDRYYVSSHSEKKNLVPLKKNSAMICNRKYFQTIDPSDFYVARAEKLNSPAILCIFQKGQKVAEKPPWFCMDVIT